MRRNIIWILAVLMLMGLDAVAQEGRLVRETIHSPSLEGNLLGDSPHRAVSIYLPPSYDTEVDMLYPVVYMLHGYLANNSMWIDTGWYGNILQSMNSWMKNRKVEEMILVMPNSYNNLKGSLYVNSATTGNWADFMVKDLVEYIDSHYRTLPQRESRGLIGFSMGGDGAIRLGLLYPDVFGCMGGVSGAYMMEELFQDHSRYIVIASTVGNWSQFSSQVYLVQVSFAMAAAFAPNPDHPPFYCELPFVYTDTKPRKTVRVQEVYDRHYRK